MLPELVRKQLQNHFLTSRETCIDCTLIFTFDIQKELNMYQMFKCQGIFLLPCIINKNVSYSNNKMLFTINLKIAHYGLSGSPQNPPSIVLLFRELASSFLRNDPCPRSLGIIHPPEVLLKSMWCSSGSNFSICPLFVPLGRNPIWSKTCHFVWTKSQFKCLDPGLAVGMFQKYLVQLFECKG